MIYKLAVASVLLVSADAFFVQAPARAAVVQGRAHTSMEVAAPAPSPLSSEIWKVSPSVKVQGSTLKTWDIGEETTERVQLSIKSDGRPVNTDVQLWHTPSYIPTKFSVYTEDGALRPIDAIIETPKNPKTVAVYNTGPLEFPFDAIVANTGLGTAYESLAGVEPMLVQGGSLKSFTFGAEVESVQILLKTGERNMKAKIELTQGPNQVKQIVEVYASKGKYNPFYVVIQTPGTNNAIRVINQGPVEFPFDAWVLPYETGSGSDLEPVLGGGGW